ncbi:unnamed protein product, partial [Staurois parvus]
LAHAHWAPGCHAEHRHYRSREDSARLDRGTVRAGTCQIQSLVIPCTVRSLWSSPVLCPQSLVISCTVSAVSGHLLYYVRSVWSSPVLCPQSLVIPVLSAVSGHLLYYVCSPLVQNFFSCFLPLKP